MDKGSVEIMTANERLVEILNEIDRELIHTKKEHHNGYRANCLLAKGVILPPATLDEKIKEAARLRYNNGRTIEEIAEIMDYNPRTIRRYLKRFEEVAKE